MEHISPAIYSNLRESGPKGHVQGWRPARAQRECGGQKLFYSFFVHYLFVFSADNVLLALTRRAEARWGRGGGDCGGVKAKKTDIK